MRKNCRIAADYSCRVQANLGTRAFAFWGNVAFFFPLIAAIVTRPIFPGYGNRDAAKGRAVREHLVEFLVADIERLAAWTLRLLVFADSLHIHHRGNRQIQDFMRCFRILNTNLQLDAAQQVGNEPIHADHVVIDEISLNARGLEAALCQQRFGKVAKLAQCYGFV